MKASTDANLEGRVMRYPRMDKEILAKYSKGIIASSGCPSGIIQTRLLLGQFDEDHYVRQANCRIFSDVTISISNSWTTV